MSVTIAERAAAPVDARDAWRLRVLRVGGTIQIVFAAFWLVRGSLAIGAPVGPSLAIVLGAVATGVLAYGVSSTAGRAPRPTGPGAAAIERAVTVATALEVVASFALPAAAMAAGRPDWVLPSVAVTVGPLLVWLDRCLGVPRYAVAGWILTVGPVMLALALCGDALAAATGLAGGGLLLSVATAGFLDLRRG